MSSHAASLKVGVVQTTLNYERAWSASARTPRINPREDAFAWTEVRRAMRAFQDGPEKPDLVLFPELAIPRTRLPGLKSLATALNVVLIAGVDYKIDTPRHTVRNEVHVIVPRSFGKRYFSRNVTSIALGKMHAAPGEASRLAALRPGWRLEPDTRVYCIDAGRLGNIGLCICYDFMDIERALLYRGEIQHLFVLAYNRDVSMFRSLADAFSRTVYCNVVVCNTGYYGGSVTVAPFRRPHRRVVFEQVGAGLFGAHVITLPVAGLVDAGGGRSPKVHVDEDDEDEFKSIPPGFRP